MRGAWTGVVVAAALLLSACRPLDVESQPVRSEAPSVAAPVASPSAPGVDPNVEARWVQAYDAAYHAMEYVLEPEDLAWIARTWGTAVTTEFGQGDVTADPALFAPWTDEWGWTPMLDNDVEVVGGDPAAVRAGLEAAAARIFMVDAEGVEHPASQLEDLAVEETLIVAYVSGVDDDGTGLGYSIDTQGAGYPEAARTMMTILVEELEKAGVHDARLVPIPDAA
ncbi:hypothetical protein [Cellulomonas sp. P5_C6]